MASSYDSGNAGGNHSLDAKEWFPPDPLPRKQKYRILHNLNPCRKMCFLSSFSEGVWGNRSLDAKERFPQKYPSRKTSNQNVTIKYNHLLRIRAIRVTIKKPVSAGNDSTHECTRGGCPDAEQSAGKKRWEQLHGDQYLFNFLLIFFFLFAGFRRHPVPAHDRRGAVSGV